MKKKAWRKPLIGIKKFNALFKKTLGENRA